MKAKFMLLVMLVGSLIVIIRQLMQLTEAEVQLSLANAKLNNRDYADQRAALPKCASVPLESSMGV